ncbi:MAG: energy-coupling factor transporter ATPase [Clostridia bacterium]|nr:energy-coupling factor transporter ATPase [Clostridia bacterium]
MIELRNVSYEYSAGAPALKHVDLQVGDGEFLAVVGPNGSGKSTLAKCLNGLLLPTEGEVAVNGLLTSDETALMELRRQVGMVFQNPDNQIVTTVVEEDVAFGPENLGIEPDEIAQRVYEALDAVDMRKFARNAPHMLSGGQKQRVAIAGVLAMRPSIMVFDEATAMLDPDGRNDVLAIMRALHAQGKTVVMITQYMEEAAIADRVAVLYDGSVAMLDTPAAVFEQCDRLRELRLDVPPVLSIRNALIAGGMDVAHAHTVEELSARIAELLKGKHQND